MTDDNNPAKGCPHAARAAAAGEGADVNNSLLHVHADADLQSAQPPTLYTFSQVKNLMEPDHPLSVTIQWIRQFLARPHKELGRPGPVCPFVPGAMVQDTIWLARVDLGSGDREAIKKTVARYRQQFLDLEPKSGDMVMMKAIMVVFPNLSADDATMVDEIQAELKPEFVAEGLMIGEFHERNEGEGLRNPNFRPLRSPIPSMAIRFMVDSDLPFLHRMMYPPALRVSFLKSYLRRFGQTLSKSQFDTALNSLVTAEIELRSGVVETPVHA
jgi:hypothetical protein